MEYTLKKRRPQQKNRSSSLPPPPSCSRLAPPDFGLAPRFHVFALGLLIVLGIVCYGNTLAAPFYFDDYINIVSNVGAHVKELSFSALRRAAFSTVPAADYPTPLFYLSLGLNYYAGGLNPWGYHLVNFIGHLVISGLVYIFFFVFLSWLAGDDKPAALRGWIALAAAAWWTVHPVNTEAVTYISQRKAEFRALFSLLTLIFYLKGRFRTGCFRVQAAWLGLALASWLAALAFRQMAIMIPFLILFFELKKSPPGLPRRLMLYALVLMFYGGLIVYSLQLDKFFGVYQTLAYGPQERLLTELRILVVYLMTLIAPLPRFLNFDFDISISRGILSPPSTLAALTLLALLIYIAIRDFRRQGLLALAVGWFFLNLLPESSIVPIDLIFLKRLYFSSLLFFLWAADGGVGWLQRLPNRGAFKWKRALIPALILITSVLCIHRNQLWRDPVAFWQDNIRKSPTKARPYDALGYIYMESKQYAEAVPLFRQAVNLDPRSARAWNNLGTAYLNLGYDARETAQILKRAINLHPGKYLPFHNLGVLSLRAGNTDEALHFFLEAHKRKPDHFPTEKLLGRLYLEQRDYAQAIYHLEQAAALNPQDQETSAALGAAYAAVRKPAEAETLLKSAPADSTSSLALAQSYLEQGKNNEAEAVLRRILAEDPHPPLDVYLELGALSREQGKLDEAKGFYRRALAADPKNVPALYNLSIAESASKNYAEEERLLKQATALDPGFYPGYNNLGALYMMRKDGERATAAFQKALKHKPDSPELNFNLASAYLHYSSQPAKALPYFEKVLALVPSHPQAEWIKAQIKRLQGN